MSFRIAAGTIRDQSLFERDVRDHDDYAVPAKRPFQPLYASKIVNNRVLWETAWDELQTGEGVLESFCARDLSLVMTHLPIKHSVCCLIAFYPCSSQLEP